MVEDPKKARAQYSFNISMSGKDGEVAHSASQSFSGPAPEVFDAASTQIERWKAEAAAVEKA